jgi:hypothetical protein
MIDLRAEGSTTWLATTLMGAVSRRGVLRGVGAMGLALVGVTGVSLDARRAWASQCEADPPCSGITGGVCDFCASHCESGGLTCDCTCDGCDCGCAAVAVCGWVPVGQCCAFTCGCSCC